MTRTLASADPDPLTDKGKRAQIIQTDLLDDLRAVPDAPPPGHVSIRPEGWNP